MFDAIVVGARCAGSPLAMLLARRGCRVLLVDKAKFPSDTVSTHVIWQAGLARAKRWGLLDRIVALGAPKIRTVGFDGGDFALSGTPPPADGVDYAIAPRRTLLDKVLVDAAVEAGAELREEVYVSEVVTESGRVTGVRGQAAGGAALDERARIVIGADGTALRPCPCGPRAEIQHAALDRVCLLLLLARSWRAACIRRLHADRIRRSLLSD